MENNEIQTNMENFSADETAQDSLQNQQQLNPEQLKINYATAKELDKNNIMSYMEHSYSKELENSSVKDRLQKYLNNIERHY